MKVNIIEIIEKCPRKLKLYVSILGKEVDNYKIDKNKIDIPVIDGSLSSLVVHNDGSLFEGGECILFPSSNYKTWKHWQRVLFEDGDTITNGTKTIKYDKSLGLSWQELDNYTFSPKKSQDKKEVVRYEGPVPEGMIILDTANFSGLVFKVGEYITAKNNYEHYNPNYIFKVKDHLVENRVELYLLERLSDNSEDKIEIKETENFRRVKVLKPFDKVLVRYPKYYIPFSIHCSIWRISYFSHFDNYEKCIVCPESSYKSCICYEGNENLLGTDKNVI